MKFIGSQHFQITGKRGMFLARPEVVAMDPNRRCHMSPHHPSLLIRPIVIAFCAGAALLGATVARAAECPENKVLAHNHDIDWKDDIGIRRKTLTMIDLNGWRDIGDLR